VNKTDRSPGGSEETIEDLEAPAQQQSDVTGGAGCGQPSMRCNEPTCVATDAHCTNFSHDVLVFEQ
jgi:hypothetical protein